MVKYKKTKKQLEVFAFEHRMLGDLGGLRGLGNWRQPLKTDQ